MTSVRLASMRKRSVQVVSKMTCYWPEVINNHWLVDVVEGEFVGLVEVVAVAVVEDDDGDDDEVLNSKSMQQQRLAS